MAKKSKDPLEKNNLKLDLGITLAALDYKDKPYFDKLDENLKKQYSPFVLMRFLSSSQDQNRLHEYHLLSTNDIVNQDFWTLSKYPDLQHLLMCMVGLGKKQYHQWIPNPKKITNGKINELFYELYPGINSLEIDIIIKSMTINDFIDLCHDYGMEDKDIKPLKEEFSKIKGAN